MDFHPNAFLTSKVSEFTFPPNKVVYTMLGQSVVSVGDSNLVMPNCNHEEADTRDVVHIRYALEQGLKRLQVRKS